MSGVVSGIKGVITDFPLFMRYDEKERVFFGFGIAYCWTDKFCESCGDDRAE